MLMALWPVQVSTTIIELYNLGFVSWLLESVQLSKVFLKLKIAIFQNYVMLYAFYTLKK